MAHISRGEAQQARNVDDLSELVQRAYALRTCVHAFLADLGELAPVQKCLLDVLAEIDDHLQVLRGQDAESSAICGRGAFCTAARRWSCPIERRKTMPKTWWLSTFLLACACPGPVAADEWLGETVMVKETAVPQVGAKRFRWNDAPIPSVVQQTNGDWLWLGIVWVKKGDVVVLDDAPAYFTNLINRGTNNVVGYVMRGVSWLAKHEFDNAIKDLNEAIRLQPRNSSFYALRGKAFHGKHAYDRAIADFNESIRLDPSNLIALNDRGCTWDAKGEFAKAIKHFDAVLRVDPRNAIAYANRSVTWFELEESEKSLADGNRAIQLDPRMASAYANRGRWYLKHGDYPEALDDFNKAIELAPREWAAYNGLARIYATAPVFEAHIRDGKQALAMAKKACELSLWDEWMPVASLAAAHAELGDFETAVKWQTKALAMSQPSKDRDQHDNEKRLELYKSGQRYYEEVSSLKEDTAADAAIEEGVDAK